MSFNFEDLFGDADLDMDCPKCKSNVNFKLKDVGNTIKCSNCSAEINLEKDSSYDETTNSADKSLEDFSNTLKNFGK